MDNKSTARLREKKRDPISRYEEYAYFQYPDDGEGLSLRESRQDLDDLNRVDDAVERLDEIVVEATLSNDFISPELLEDVATYPVQNWWWHLGKIRNHSYPAELLPEHLRAIYQQTKSKAI